MENNTERLERDTRARVQSLWIRPAAWEAMCIVKEDIHGTWSRMMEIFVEKMISSGLMSEDAIKRVREIAERESIGIVPDSGWNADFEARESWPLAAGHIKTMAEESKKMGPLLEELVEVIETHAITMAEIEENREEPEE